MTDGGRVALHNRQVMLVKPLPTTQSIILGANVCHYWHPTRGANKHFLMEMWQLCRWNSCEQTDSSSGGWILSWFRFCSSNRNVTGSRMGEPVIRRNEQADSGSRWAQSVGPGGSHQAPTDRPALPVISLTCTQSSESFGVTIDNLEILHHSSGFLS